MTLDCVDFVAGVLNVADSISQGLQTSNSLTGNSYSLNLQSSSLGFGNNSLGTIGSPSIGNLGGEFHSSTSLSFIEDFFDLKLFPDILSTSNINLVTSLSPGMGSGSSMARRDSLERTSVLSPLSQDFRTAKWTNSYGAVGNVAASPGPMLGGSLTPPPLGVSSGLGLGNIVAGAGTRMISAAPGAEAKFRNGASNGGYFNSPNTSALFPALKKNMGVDKCQGRSRLLEDFRNNRYPNLQLRDLVSHIVEFSQDQHGSRFIQQKLERATPSDKQMVFAEILNASYSLMTDVFG